LCWNIKISSFNISIKLNILKWMFYHVKKGLRHRIRITHRVRHRVISWNRRCSGIGISYSQQWNIWVRVDLCVGWLFSGLFVSLDFPDFTGYIGACNGKYVFFRIFFICWEIARIFFWFEIGFINSSFETMKWSSILLKNKSFSFLREWSLITCSSTVEIERSGWKLRNVRICSFVIFLVFLVLTQTNLFN